MAGFDHTKLPSSGIVDYRKELSNTLISVKAHIEKWCVDGCHEYWNPEDDENQCSGCPLDSLLKQIEEKQQ